MVDLVQLAHLAGVVVRQRDGTHAVTPSASTARAACRDRAVEIEARVEALGRQVLGDLRVLREHCAEGTAGLPRRRRGALDEPVRVVARETGLDQREQHRLTEHEAVRRREVLAHPRPVDDHAVGDPEEPLRHVVREDQGIGEHDALHRGVRHVALVPQRDVLESRLQVAAQDACETTELLGAPRVPLVGHGARPLLRARRERFLDLADLRPLEVPDLERERLDGGPEGRARVQDLSVTVARHHLRRRGGLEPELLAHVRLDLGIDVGIGADRARHLAHRDRGARPHQSGAVAAELERPEGELAAEGDRLRVDPVRASCHRGVALLTGAACEHRFERVDRVDHEVEGAHERDRQRGVDDVVGREPVVHPLRGRSPDPLLDHVDERGGLVVGDGLPRPDRLEVEPGPFSDGRGVGRGHDTQLRPGFGGEDLDLEPRAEPGLVGEEVGDFARGVAVDHADPFSCRHSTSPITRREPITRSRRCRAGSTRPATRCTRPRRRRETAPLRSSVRAR